MQRGGVRIVPIDQVPLQRLQRQERQLGVGELGEAQRPPVVILAWHQPRALEPVERPEDVANLANRRVPRHAADVQRRRRVVGEPRGRRSAPRGTHGPAAHRRRRPGHRGQRRHHAPRPSHHTSAGTSAGPATSRATVPAGSHRRGRTAHRHRRRGTASHRPWGSAVVVGGSPVASSASSSSSPARWHAPGSGPRWPALVPTGPLVPAAVVSPVVSHPFTPAAVVGRPLPPRGRPRVPLRRWLIDHHLQPVVGGVVVVVARGHRGGLVVEVEVTHRPVGSGRHVRSRGTIVSRAKARASGSGKRNRGGVK